MLVLLATAAWTRIVDANLARFLRCGTIATTVNRALRLIRLISDASAYRLLGHHRLHAEDRVHHVVLNVAEQLLEELIPFGLVDHQGILLAVGLKADALP